MELDINELVKREIKNHLQDSFDDGKTLVCDPIKESEEAECCQGCGGCYENNSVMIVSDLGPVCFNCLYNLAEMFLRGD